jgi:glutamate synthase (NADPH/NADH) large chain
MTGGVALILGPTGRNVAAGMSGGVAYLLDAAADRVNADMVELQRLGDDDIARVTDLVRRHAEETGSAVATGLLTDGAIDPSRFTKVMPRDYERVLAARAAAEATGRDIDEAIMEASHG